MEFEFQCTENDYKRFYKFYYKSEFQKRIWGAILLPILIGYMFSGEPFNLTRFICGAIASEIIFVGFYVIPYIIAINKIRNLIAKEPRYLEKKKLMITDEGLYFETETRNGTWKWESIASLNSNVDFISLLLVDKRFYLIPKRAFLAENDSTNFIGIIQSRIGTQRSSIKVSPDTLNKKPPYLLGLICLIPLIGAFVGLVFIILGITRFKDKWFTLIGVAGIVFTVIIYSTLFYAGKHSSVFTNGFRDLSQMQLNNLVKDIEFYKMQNEQYPDSLQQLTKENTHVFIYDPIQSNQGETDNLFKYERVDNQYNLFSSGVDGIPKTNDDLYPQVSENLIGKIGLIKYNIKPEIIEPKESTNR